MDRAPAVRFAPLSGGPSTRLRLAAGYFTASGALTLALLAAGLAGAALGHPAATAALRAQPLGPGLRLASALLMLGAGRLIARRSRGGGALAVALLVPPVLSALAGHAVPRAALAVAVVGVGVVLSVWREVDGGAGAGAGRRDAA